MNTLSEIRKSDIVRCRAKSGTPLTYYVRVASVSDGQIVGSYMPMNEYNLPVNDEWNTGSFEEKYYTFEITGFENVNEILNQ